ncbi:MAG: permease prefix domain 1-containing protein [Pseudoclavibacter sp.]
MNETIRTYIGGLFAGLPSTPDTQRAHSELLQMSEDKYRELRESGASENEATGRVITEFGNLDELADDLGIRREMDDAANEPEVPTLSVAETDEVIRLVRRSSLQIAAGVFVILIGLAATVFLGATAFERAAAVPVLLCTAVAVGLFIAGGRAITRSSGRLDRGEARVEPAIADGIRTMRERTEGGFTTALIVGVGLIVLSVSFPAMFGAFGQGFGAVPAIGTSAMFVVLGAGIATLIVAAMRRSLLGTIEAAGRPHQGPADEANDGSELIGRVASVYWPCIVLVFLTWGFLFGGWGIAWVVFPLGGIAFGIFASIASMVRGT